MSDEFKKEEIIKKFSEFMNYTIRKSIENNIDDTGVRGIQADTKNDICCVCPPHVVDVMIKNGKPYLEISGRAPDQLTNEEKQLYKQLRELELKKQPTMSGR